MLFRSQSVYVINAVKNLMIEGFIGILLTGLMVMLFLKDRRSALIVILTIPVSLISGVLFLNIFGQTINIMSLSGLALAVGILVDESTVTVENIHRHLEMGKSKAKAVWEACNEIAFPKLLILLCILAAFVPRVFDGWHSRCNVQTVSNGYQFHDDYIIHTFSDFRSGNGIMADQSKTDFKRERQREPL